MKRNCLTTNGWYRHQWLLLGLAAAFSLGLEARVIDLPHANGVQLVQSSGSSTVSRCQSCTIRAKFSYPGHSGSSSLAWDAPDAEKYGVKAAPGPTCITFEAGSGPLKSGSFVVTATLNWTCTQTNPPGCDPSSGEVQATATVEVTGDDEDDGCGGSCGDKPTLGTASLRKFGVDLRLFLGAANRDAHGQYKTAGYLALRADTPSAALATPNALVLPYMRAGVERFPADDAQPLKQVKTPEGLVHVTNVTTLPNSYELQFFNNQLVTTNAGAGGYNAPDRTNAIVIWTITNLNGSQNSLQLLEDRGAGQQTYTYTYSLNGSADTWNLVRPDSSYSISQTNRDTLTRTFELHNADTTLVQKRQETYEYIPRLGGTVLTQLVEGDGATTQTTSYGYYPDDNYPNNPPTPEANQLRRVDYPDGNWVVYQYDDSGRKQYEYSAWNNSPPPDGDDDPNPTVGACRVVIYEYDSDPEEEYLPWRTSVYLVPDDAGENWTQYRVSFTETYRTYSEGQLVSEQTCDAEGLCTTTYYITAEGPNQGQVAKVERPDGTVSLFGYAPIDGNGVATTTNLVGETDWQDGVYNGQRIITQTGETGRVLSRIVNAIQDGAVGPVLSHQTWEYATAGQDYSVTDVLADLTTSYAYNCCGLSDVTDPEGVVTHYDYDALHRQVSAEVRRGGATGVKTTRVLDAAGRVLATQRLGIGDSPTQAVTIQQYQYNVLGQVIRSTNALGGVTTNLYEPTGAGGRREITLYPDGGTRTNDYYLDGGPHKVTGTATAPVQYEASVEYDDYAGRWRECEKQTKLDGSWTPTSEWTMTYRDGDGRAYKTLYADDSASRTTYNTYGQLAIQADPDDVTTLYAYNGQGELEYSAVDLNDNDWIDLSADRITRTVRTAVAAAGGKPDLVRTDTYVWKDGESAGTLVSRSEVSASGPHTWQTVWRIAADDDTMAVTESQTTFNSGTHERTVTVTAPDATQTVSVYLYGLLRSVTRYDAATPTRQQITRMAYAYDKYDRQTTITDARNGATTLVLNDADLVTSTTSPDPGGGPQVTATFYDELGRAIGTRQPDGTTTSNLYSPAGLLTNTWGSRTYPVEYAYDPQGRMLTMKTWQGFSTGSGTATTRWNYDAYRGWLSSKDYPNKDTGSPPEQVGSTGPTYEYTPGGRLSSRTWRRLGTGGNRIATTYTYGFNDGLSNNEHGDLVGIAYANDPSATPEITYAYDRQGRRSEVERDGVTTTLGYDDANQPLAEEYDGGLLDGLSVSWTHNNALQRTALSLSGASGSYSVGYTYSDAGRLDAVNTGANGAAYAYLANSPLVGQIVFTNSGTTRMTTSKQYDHVNRLTSISSAPSASSPISFDYLYNRANQRIRTTLADGSYWVYSYDALGQVTSGKRLWQDGTPVAGQQYEYAFDDIGNRKSTGAGGDAEWGPLRPASYTPNRLNQYSERDVPGAVDILGVANPTTNVTVNGNIAYRKGEYFDHPLSTPNANAPWYDTVTVHSPYSPGQTTNGTLFVPKTPEQFAYDADGNLTNDGRWSFVWDAENRLIKMEPSGTVTPPAGSRRRLEFAYDYQGRRIASRMTNLEGATSVLASNIFLYDGWNLVAELNATNSGVIRSYVWGLDLSGSSQGAGGVGGLLKVTYNGSATTNCFLAYDGNGNVCGLTDAANGSLVAHYEYGPFGEVIRATGPMAKVNPFRFSTKYQDNETDLLYYGYRHYSASTGRWITRDPITQEANASFPSTLATFNLEMKSLPCPRTCRAARSNRRPFVEAEALNECAFLSNSGISSVDFLGLMGCSVARPCCILTYTATAATPWGIFGGKCIYAGTLATVQPVTTRKYPSGCCPKNVAPDKNGVWAIYDDKPCVAAAALPATISIWMWSASDAPNGNDFTR